MTGAPVSVDNGQCAGDTVGGSVPAGVSVASGAKAGTVAVGSGVFGDIGPGFSLGVAKLTGTDAFSRASATSSSCAWQ